MVFRIRPPRCTLVNVVTGEPFECLFNPTQLTEKVDVHYSRLAVPGLSHQVLQYQGTGNRELSGVEFYLDRTFAAEPTNDAGLMDFRAFLRALTVPPAEHTAPPRTLFVWPGALTVLTVLTGVEFQYRQFAVTGRPLVYTATVRFEEILDVRVAAETLREEV